MNRLKSQQVARIQIYEAIFTGFILICTNLFFSFFSDFIASDLIKLAIMSIVILLFVIVKIKTYRFVDTVVFWYESLLDSIPFPLSITDSKMNWTFINKPVEDMLNLKRENVVGQHCSNWGAGICKTQKCGITCLNNGITQTTFEQLGMDFQVDTAYILDKQGKQVGHIEVVQDISKMIKMQKAESKLAREMAQLIEDINELCMVFVKDIDDLIEDIHAMKQGSTDQSQSVGELSTFIIDISNQVDTNTNSSEKATSLFQTMKIDAEEANTQMSDMMQAVQEISDAAKAIENIIKVINDIAYQTNILALNAAVEAARAGQYGKGFAVVASEVRNLASKSADAAQNTSNLIANSIEKTELGKRISAETSASLNKMIEVIQQGNQIIASIAESSGTQNKVIKNIQSGVEYVSNIAKKNFDTAQQSVFQTKGLSEETQRLKDLLKAFNSENKKIEVI